MAIETYANTFNVSLTMAISTSNTSIQVTQAAVIDGGFRILIDNELMQVTSGGTTTTWNVTRNMEGTSVSGHSAGVPIIMVLTSGSLDALRSQWSGVGTFANRPTTGMKKGDTYQCTDSSYLYVYDGASWTVFWGTMKGMVPPPSASSLTWANQGGATAVNTDGTLFITAPTNSQDSLRYLYKSYPVSTPFTFTVGLTVNFPGVDYCRAGIGISDGTKIFTHSLLCYHGYSGFWGTEYCQWSILNNGSVSGQSFITTGPNPTASPVYLSVTDNGSNVLFYAGTDLTDLTRYQISSVGRTSYLTPTQIGVFLDTYNTTYASSMRIIHWYGI